MKRINILDAVAGGYLGWRALEPAMLRLNGTWNSDQMVKELRYRFGGIGNDGHIAPMGAVETYLPPIIIEVVKKGLHKAGFHVNLGPFSL